MFIEPRTNIRLLQNVPIDEDYRHTVLFESLNSQTSYMTSKTKYNLTNYSYQRTGRGRARVGVLVDNLYDCNYMMFQNSAFGSKWFYAFITNVEYVNNETADIFFKIDVMQSWLFDVTLDKCMVLREHTNNDAIGANTQEENVGVGELVVGENWEHTVSSYGIAMYWQPGKASALSPSFDGNVYSPLLCSTASVSSSGSSITDLLEQYSDAPERIASLYMIPNKLISEAVFDETFVLGRDTSSFNYGDGTTYTPKNKKLFCYPYSVLTVDNYNGDVEEYHWEDFKNPRTATFAWIGTRQPKPAMECYPTEYKGVSEAKQFKVSYDDFPQCPYLIDNFRAWASSTYKKQLANMALQVGNMVAGGMTGAGASVMQSESLKLGQASQASAAGLDYLASPEQLTGLFGQAVNTAIDYQYMKHHGTSIGGVVGESGLNFADNRVGFRLLNYIVRPEYAKIIDDYFDMFGYATNQIKVPNRTGRPYWNYVKTANSLITGNAPAMVMRELQNIYNTGITFWHSPSYVGNYDLDNRLV